MKKNVTISLFIFWAIVASILIAGLISNKKDDNDANKAPDPAGVNNPPPEKSVVPVSNVLLSASELAKHNSDKSCWLLISGKIYDVTPFIRQHPGGAGEILQNCGQDATAAYDSRGNTGSHSSSARSMLAGYYLGDLGQVVTGNSIK